MENDEEMNEGISDALNNPVVRENITLSLERGLSVEEFRAVMELSIKWQIEAYRTVIESRIDVASREFSEKGKEYLKRIEKLSGMLNEDD